MMKEKAILTKVKGTVLYTVVCVMMILIVFLMGTLALAATANNRAMNSYTSAQTQATARAAVEAVLAAMQNDKDVAAAVAGVNDSTKNLTIDSITFENAAYLGRVTDARVDFVGKKWEVDPDTSELKEITVLKISATVQQGRESSTVAVYVQKDVDPPSPSNGGGGGFVSTGSARADNGTSAFGGTYVGFDKNKVKSDFIVNQTPVVFETDVQINGNMQPGDQFKLVVKGPGTGMTIWGNLTFGNQGITMLTTNATIEKFNNGNYSYRDIPYIYVDGKIDARSTTETAINCKNDGTEVVMPLNIFCGSIIGRQFYAGADIYCFDTAETSEFSRENQKSALYDWTAKVIEPGAAAATAHTAGSFYTKGNLKLDGGADFKGEVVVEGDLTIASGDVKIAKNLTVGGSLKVSGGTLTVDGTVICDSITGYSGSNTQRLRSGEERLKSAEYEEVKKDCIFVKDFNLNNTGNKSGWMMPDYSAWVEVVDLNNTPGYCGDGHMEIDAANHKYSWTCQNHGTTTGDTPTFSVYYRKGTTEEVSKSEAFEIVGADGQPVPVPVIFPRQYEKEVILGQKDMAGNAITDAKDAAATKIVTTVDEVLKSNVNPYNTETYVPGTSVNEATNLPDGGTPKPNSYAADVESNVYNLSGGADKTNITSTGATDNAIRRIDNTHLEVVDSCTITGGAQGTVLYIHPGGSPETSKDIWIKLKNYSPSTSQIILDDINYPSATVNFLIEGDVKFSSTTFPITTTRIQNIIDNKIVFQINTDDAYRMYQRNADGSIKKDADGNDLLMYPEITHIPINIYSLQTGNPTLTVDNSALLVGNIMAPYMTLNYASNVYDFGSDFYYNGYKASDPALKKIGCLGCCVIYQFSPNSKTDNFDLLYVPRQTTPQSSENLTDALMTSWGLLYYENY